MDSIIYNPQLKLILLIGLPGSGKSTLAQHFLKHLPNTVWVNQDTLGKTECLDMVSQSVSGDTKAIIDRCNLTAKDRKEFTNKLKTSQQSLAIVFQIDQEECTYRAENRDDHPVCKKDTVKHVIAQMMTMYENVDQKKEKINEVVYIKSSDDLNYILGTWNIPAINVPSVYDLFKFPRTRHLVNIGGAERDDLILSKDEQLPFTTKFTTREEKIDGANLGISFDPETGEYKFQNRAHYVNIASSSQFAGLDKWKNRHLEDLYIVLGSGDLILYGEWLQTVHSIHYTKLPDLFVAFDIFDKTVKKFWSRRRVEEILSQTNIKLIRVISQGINSLDEIIKCTQEKSQYYDGPVEGTYVRICDDADEFTIDRAKIVRANFLQGRKTASGGIVHWSKNAQVFNKVNYE